MNIEQSISAVRSARHADDGDESLNQAIAVAFGVLAQCRSLEMLRACLPSLGDLDVPTRLIFAMHVHIMMIGGGQIHDRKAFATFLDLFYEEWSEWAEALRAEDD